MAGTATQLQRAAEAEALTQDHLVLQFETELERVIRQVDREIARLVRSLETSGGRLVRTQAALGRAIRLRQDLIAGFRRSGFDTLADQAFSDRLDALAEQVLRHSAIAASAANLTSVDVHAILAFKELRLADLLDWGTDVARRAWQVTVDGVLGLRPVDALVADLGRVLEVSIPRARTLYDTAVSSFTRQVSLLHTTGDPAELFLYAGPLDANTRPFCRSHVGRVFARSEIDQMNNGQIGDVFITGGGYNCRHRFMRVSILDDELQQLHESDGRLPHIQQQLDALKAAA